MAQLSLFSRSQVASWRDRTKARNYSPEGEQFRRDHKRHREWGLRQRYGRKEMYLRIYGDTAPPYDRTSNPEVSERSAPASEPASAERLPVAASSGNVSGAQQLARTRAGAPGNADAPGDAGTAGDAGEAGDAGTAGDVGEADPATETIPAGTAAPARQTAPDRQATFSDEGALTDQGVPADQAIPAGQGLLARQSTSAGRGPSPGQSTPPRQSAAVYHVRPGRADRAG